MARLATPVALIKSMPDSMKKLTLAVNKALGGKDILDQIRFEVATSVGSHVPCVVVSVPNSIPDTQRKVVVMNEDYTVEQLASDAEYIAAWAALIIDTPKPDPRGNAPFVGSMWSKELLKKFSDNLMATKLMKDIRND